MNFSQHLMATAVATAVTTTGFVCSCRADTLVVMLDVSGSTPITQPNFLRTAKPMLADLIRPLPIKNSRVKVFTVGDDKSEPLTIDQWVQRRFDAQGDTAMALANRIPTEVERYLLALGKDPSKLQRESSLSTAFLDASKWCDAASPCTIVFFTDGMEYQPRVVEWPRQIAKPLPNINGLDLKGARIVMYGVGLGTASSIRIAAEQHWERWLKAHNAGTVDVRRL